jgi:hypothetical protein
MFFLFLIQFKMRVGSGEAIRGARHKAAANGRFCFMGKVGISGCLTSFFAAQRLWKFP